MGDYTGDYSSGYKGGYQEFAAHMYVHMRIEIGHCQIGFAHSMLLQLEATMSQRNQIRLVEGTPHPILAGCSSGMKERILNDIVLSSF